MFTESLSGSQAHIICPHIGKGASVNIDIIITIQYVTELNICQSKGFSDQKALVCQTLLGNLKLYFKILHCCIDSLSIPLIFRRANDSPENWRSK